MLIGACETLHPKPLHDFQKLDALANELNFEATMQK
jgi:hypothetical protein